MSRLTDEELARHLYEVWCVEARKQIAVAHPTFNLALVEAGLRPWSEVKDTYAREGWLAVAREVRSADLKPEELEALRWMRSVIDRDPARAHRRGQARHGIRRRTQRVQERGQVSIYMTEGVHHD